MPRCKGPAHRPTAGQAGIVATGREIDKGPSREVRPRVDVRSRRETPALPRRGPGRGPMGPGAITGPGPSSMRVERPPAPARESSGEPAGETSRAARGARGFGGLLADQVCAVLDDGPVAVAWRDIIPGGEPVAQLLGLLLALGDQLVAIGLELLGLLPG